PGPKENQKSVPEQGTEVDRSLVSQQPSPPVLDPTPTPAAAKTEAPATATLKSALKNTESHFLGRIKSLFSGGVPAEVMDQIEEVLYTSDLGPQTVQSLLQQIEKDLSSQQKKDFSVVRDSLKNKIKAIFAESALTHAPAAAPNPPQVIMVVGVNGAGKTTSIGKLSAQWAQQGKKVLVAAGDTFRAAAEAQLKTWTERAQVEIFSANNSKDPSGLAFDAVTKALAQNYDVVIIDTAGRLHTQSHLMEELKKVKRVLQKVIPTAPHEVWIVLDANSGQNAILQAKEFNQALGLTGAILTKMDGTAKGGVAVGLVNELKIPIKKIGIGEKINDLQDFSADDFVESIFG
ncbi:MAG: signal recognition particle-docking protein FtsY, partial [Pseudobdellovibrionaceae bacterium]